MGLGVPNPDPKPPSSLAGLDAEFDADHDVSSLIQAFLQRSGYQQKNQMARMQPPRAQKQASQHQALLRTQAV